ncbi:MAG: hypothetical protein M3S32_07220 [Acidobacteriota bacterium]|nr:hypothetical protein [Acidobacteriota bacterium]
MDVRFEITARNRDVPVGTPDPALAHLDATDVDELFSGSLVRGFCGGAAAKVTGKGGGYLGCTGAAKPKCAVRNALRCSCERSWARSDSSRWPRRDALLPGDF